MKRVVEIVFSIVFCSSVALAQEQPVDSLKLELSKPLQSELFLSEPIFSPDSIVLFSFDDRFPQLFGQVVLSREKWMFDIDGFEKKFEPLNFSLSPIMYSPPGTSLFVLNQAVYQVNDRFSIGGNSVGWKHGAGNIGSPFEPLNFNAASMFFEYKVSKKFSIGAQFSVGKGSAWPAP